MAESSEGQAVPDGQIGGRPRTTDGVLGADADCEVQLGYAIALYLGRDDFCSIIVEESLVERLSHDKKLDVLTRLMKRHDVTFAPYDTLVAELRELRRFRNELAHTIAHRGDSLQRVRRRTGRNVLTRLTQDQVDEQLDRGMRCSSALAFLPTYLRDRPAIDGADPGARPPLYADPSS